jgi:peptide-methionine (S)-S-oxide reductase
MYLAMGCFWGAEELFWQLPGVTTTAVGYQGGTVEAPTYEQVCTGATGHAESVLVEYDPTQVSTREILRVFWEHHDPTQGNRQGNDIGPQYRSMIFCSSPEQTAIAEETMGAYQAAIDERGYGAITTEIVDAADHHFWPAEEYHQKYLLKNPFGYRCHANTGVALPASP